MINIMIVDDHQLVIDGIKLMLENEPDMLCIGEANSGEEALKKLKNFSVDVLLLDINMPGMNGLECCRAIQVNFPTVRVLMLSMLREGSLVKILLKEGAAGYLLKNAGKDEILNAIRKVYEGKRALSTDLLDVFLEDSQLKKQNMTSPFPKISRREKQVLQLIVGERTTAEIAEELFISFGTVETHRRNLLLKLDARNTAGLVRKALEYDLC